MARKMRSAELGTDASIDHRLALTLNGLYMVYKTAGRGVGAAGFEENISGEDLLVPLPILRFGARWNAHNFWIEGDRLYASFYNGGLRVVDISGELKGNLYYQNREIAAFFRENLRRLQ